MIALNNTVSASITGFENPTLQFRDQALNLNELFVYSPSSQRIIHSPSNELSLGIAEGDWLLVDSSRQPLLSDVVLMLSHDESYLVKWENLRNSSTFSASDFEEIIMVGVVTMSIHHYRHPVLLPEHESMICLDLHKLLVEQEHSTVICKADGESMRPFVHSGDLLLLERHLKPNENDVCILALNNDIVCKRVHLRSRCLSSDNPKFYDYQVSDSDYLRLHGVVRYSLRLHRPICMG
ncbi:S24 family peptidase [Vibrio sp. THAF190c]|uniref:S24 family peptidase n=1 Tax=Vibrio sp. THAF190c TaxID=2587865 RepID=UPI0012682BC2|nr:S24 family peptidase [Vibrio sp. THAF190c]QFT13325.1 DNA polymerase V subunit UmuD [Vibrio sp. THAF190c]